MNYKMIDIRTNYAADSSMGGLSILEGSKDLGYEIKRFYYIHGTKADIRRGHHAHKTLWQFLFCISGSISVHMDDSVNQEDVVLDSPAKGLLMGPGVWHTMDWLEDDAILCVAASDFYDEGDYLRNYDGFLEYMKEHPELLEEN